MGKNDYWERNPNQDIEWHNYIFSFYNVVKTKSEKRLIEAILNRKTPEQLYSNPSESSEQPQVQPTVAVHQPQYTQALDDYYQQQPAQYYYAEQAPTQPQKPPMDSSLLLLYFGAFLLVTAAGLFVALANFGGAVRTATVILTTALLYSGGFWLLKKKPKLAQAGVSFMGTAMVMAPLVGVAYFNLIGNQENGALTWLVTSLGCGLLYLHALKNIHHQLITYLLIGSFVSAIESAVLTFTMPSYAYAWAAIVAALGLQVIGYKKSQNLEDDPTYLSSQILVPLSILGSALMLPSFGSSQFAITLLLAAGFYGLAAYKIVAGRRTYTIAAQLSALGAVANTAYLINDSWTTVSLTMSLITLLYSTGILLTRRKYLQNLNLNLVAVGAASAAVMIGFVDAWAMVVAITAVAVLAFTTWLRLGGQLSYSVLGSSLLLLPLVIGQFAINPRLDSLGQLILWVPVGLLVLLSILLSSWYKSLAKYQNTSNLFYVIVSTLILICGFIAGFNTLVLATVAIWATFIGLYYLSKERDWWLAACIITVLPSIYSLVAFGADDLRFALSVLVGLAVAVGMSLASRMVIIRWFVTGYALLGPVALGAGGLGFSWDSGGYAGGYLLTMLGLLLGRAIARGKLLVSSKVAVNSYEKSASIAFVVGYISAASLAVLISLFDDQSQLITTLILGFLATTVILVSRYIEQRSEAVVMLPIILELALFSGLRPDLKNSNEVLLTAVLASVVGVLCYVGAQALLKPKSHARYGVLLASVISSYFGMIFVLVPNEIPVALPVSLAIAGALTMYHNRNSDQSLLEISIFVLLAAFHWQLYLLDITNIHIHTHALALSLAGFAYWRSLRKETNEMNGYVVALFLVATVPMAFAALAGQEDGLYGLILIVQQAIFLTIGALVGNKFLTKGGLWVALGAVLYQLRDLGWAFVALIGIAIIGVAVYRLQKHSDSQNDQQPPTGS